MQVGMVDEEIGLGVVIPVISLTRGRDLRRAEEIAGVDATDRALEILVVGRRYVSFAERTTT